MIVITGMHRSGTSLVARMCCSLGASVGPQDDLISGDRWNRSGYFENREVVGLNCALIHGICGRASYLRLPGAEVIESRAQGLESAMGRVGESLRGCIAKDPRFCLTLDSWRRRRVPIEDCIVCLRHPWAVARSLRRRNRLPLRMGYGLWREHLRRLMASLSSSTFLLINYHDLVNAETRTTEISRLRSRLKRDALASAAHRVEEIVRVEDDHFGAEKMAGESVPHDIQCQWDELQHLHAGQVEAG